MLSNTKLFLIITTVILLVNGCKDADEEYTIKGRVVKSCDDQQPVAGESFILTFNYGINNRFEEINAITNQNGEFELKYKGKVGLSELTIRAKQANGLSYKSYMSGLIPLKNINVGTLYNEDNFRAYVRVKPFNNTSSNDTIFYDYYLNNFSKFLVGPFANNQIIDTIIDRTTVFYDAQNEHKIHYSYSWRMNSFGDIKSTINKTYIPCKSSNYIDIEF